MLSLVETVFLIKVYGHSGAVVGTDELYKGYTKYSSSNTNQYNSLQFNNLTALN